MSLDKITVTLYDLLGYLLPGYVLLLACCIAEASFWSSSLFALSRIGRNPILSAIVAYFLGQTSHGIASLIKTKKYKLFDDRGRYRLNAEVSERIVEALKETYALKLEPNQQLSKIDVYLLADSYVLASGGSVERDMLTAREGFLKSSMIAFAVLAVTVVSTLFSGSARVQVQPQNFIVATRLSVVLLTVLFISLTWLFRQRFIFFNCAKNNNALLTFLALRSVSATKAKTAQSKAEKD